MSEGRQFTIGSEVACSDGGGGRVSRVVIDPVARVLTHLVVEPSHGGDPRLVPIGLVRDAPGRLCLECTSAELAALDAAIETEFLPGATADYGYGEGQSLSLPYFGLGVGRRVDLGSDEDLGPITVSHDRVPVGEVEVRRGERVHATDGDIGRVRGLVIDARDHGVTHFLLDEGHLWGSKRVAIPISAVKSVDGGVHIDLSTTQVRDLPAVALQHDA